MSGLNTPILLSDYNNLQSSISTILGTDYGQTVLSTQKSTGNIIYTTDWNNLISDINKANIHQFGSINTLQSLTNTTIIGNDEYVALNTIITSISNDITNIHPSQGTIISIDSYTSNNSWSGLISEVISIGFNTSNDLNYFFNSGGNFTISANATQTDSYVSTLISNIGITTIKKNSTLSGSGIITVNGFVNFTTTNQLIYNYINGYTSYKIYGKVSSDSKTIIFTIEYILDISLTNHYNPITSTGLLTTEIQALYANQSVIVNVPVLNSRYYISQNKSLLFEQSTNDDNNTITFTINTIGISNGTNIYWNTTLTNSPNLNNSSGSIVINNNVATLNITVNTTSDNNMKSFIVNFYNDSGLTNLISSSESIYIIQHGSITFGYALDQSFIVPDGIVNINISMSGGGGGSGGSDTHNGHIGYGGIELSGNIIVNPADNYSIVVGGGGQGGFNHTNNTSLYPIGGNGYAKGGNGGTAGNNNTNGTSGDGGAGGGSSAIILNGLPVIVAGGGAGGGGGGQFSSGLAFDASIDNNLNNNKNGGNGTNKGYDDGGGAGGGGGGYTSGGLGGGLQIGDNGAYSGFYGDSLIPVGFTEGYASNGGIIVGSGNESGNGDDGHITISW